MKINTPLVMLLLVSVVSSAALLIQRQEHQDRELAVAEATRTIDGILNEAQQALSLNRAFLGQPCTPQLARQLGRSAALSPHLRGIRLLQEGLTVCASLSGAPDLSLQSLLPGQLQLRLLSGDVLTPGSPVLVLTERFPEGQVAVSLSGVFIRRQLSATPDRPALLFRTADREMNAQGRIRLYTPAGAFRPSGTYPFVLVPDPQSPVALTDLLRAVLPWMLLSLLSAALATLFCQRLLRRHHRRGTRFLRALKRGDIRPWYQPVMDCRTGALGGCEVVARWHTRRGKIIPPDRFMPLVEKNGLAVQLAQHLLSQVVRDLTDIRDALPPDFHLIFSISADFTRNAGLMQQCRALQTTLPGVVLVAECSGGERTDAWRLLSDGLPVRRMTVAPDIPGGRYASPDTLTVDYIRLSRAFTAQITEANLAGERMLPVAVVTDIAHRLNQNVMAEGVETACQRAWLTAHGVDWLQGTLFSRPLPLAEFTRYLRQPAPGSADEEKGPE